VIAGSRELAADLRSRALRLFQHPRCRSLLAHLRPEAGSRKIRTGAGGGVAFAAVGERLIGRGADLIVVDDPISPNDALDARKRKAVLAWFEAEVEARLNSKGMGAVALVMQRVHHDDLTARLLEQGGWPRLALPAIAARDERWTLSTGGVVTRLKGEPLHPARESKAQLRELLLSLGAVHFAAQYQQAPLHDTSGWRTGMFHERRPDGWTVDHPLPRGFMGRVPETSYLLHELFGGPEPPRRGSFDITEEEWAIATQRQQARLIASLADD
jgi:hypothetical protein